MAIESIRAITARRTLLKAGFAVTIVGPLSPLSPVSDDFGRRSSHLEALRFGNGRIGAMVCGETIELLPVLPRAWPNGSIRGLRTRGGCTVDLAWRDGRLDDAHIAGRNAGSRTVTLHGKRRTIRVALGRIITLRPEQFA